MRDEIVDRFCLLGTAGDHVAKLGHLRDLGVDQFGVYLMHDDEDATLDAAMSSPRSTGSPSRVRGVTLDSQVTVGGP